jgi:hypothetical protein
LGCKEGSLDRDAQVGVDVGLTMLEKWRRPEDAGVVNQDVDSAEALDSDCGEAFRDRLLTGVAGDPSNSLAAGIEFVRRIPEDLFSAAVDDHFRAALTERTNEGAHTRTRREERERILCKSLVSLYYNSSTLLNTGCKSCKPCTS